MNYTTAPSALSLKARTPEAIAWQIAYHAGKDAIGIHAAQRKANAAARRKGIKAAVIPAGRPGSTVLTLSGLSMDGTFACRMAGDGKTVTGYQIAGKSYKSRAAYVETCKAIGVKPRKA